MVEQVDSGVIVNEWQLGDSLGQAVAHGDKSEFAILLAMLSQDIRDSAQFAYPETPEPELKPLPFKGFAADKLAAEPQDFDIEAQRSALFQQGGVAAVKLSLAMFPYPLAENNDPTAIPDEVKDNLSLHTQARLKQTKLSKEVELNEAGLYDILQQIHAEPEAA